MADCIWDGSTDSNPTETTNWSTNAVPAAGDHVIIPSDATVNIDGGDLSGNAVASLVVEDGCAIAIGSSTTYLQFDLGASFAFDPADVTVAADTITEALHGLHTGQPAYITTTIADPPLGLVVDTRYYVIVVDANTFQLATTRAGALAGPDVNDIDIQDHGTGVHTLHYGGAIHDWGTGTRYLDCDNSGYWCMLGRGTVGIDGQDGDYLHIDPSGTATVHVGPVSGTPAEFDEIGRITGGTVTLDWVWTLAHAAVPVHAITGGTTTARSSMTNVYQYGGSLIVEDAQITNFYSTGGTCTYNSDDTITLFIIEGGGRLDFGGDLRAVTVTQGQIHAGGSVLDPYGRVTWTNEIEAIRCDLADVTLSLGSNREYQVTAI